MTINLADCQFYNVTWTFTMATAICVLRFVLGVLHVYAPGNLQAALGMEDSAATSKNHWNWRILRAP